MPMFKNEFYYSIRSSRFVNFSVLGTLSNTRWQYVSLCERWLSSTASDRSKEREEVISSRKDACVE
jgi:hypothetical protein